MVSEASLMDSLFADVNKTETLTQLPEFNPAKKCSISKFCGGNYIDI